MQERSKSSRRATTVQLRVTLAACLLVLVLVAGIILSTKPTVSDAPVETPGRVLWLLSLGHLTIPGSTRASLFTQRLTPFSGPVSKLTEAGCSAPTNRVMA